jgi:hypothetical protein
MHHKQPAAVRSEVNGVPLERHAPVVALKAVQEIVVVSDDIDDLCAFSPFAQQLLNHVIVFLRPIDRPPQRPYVDQVPDDIERFELRLTQESQEGRRLAPSRPQMHVGNPTGSVVLHQGVGYSQSVHSAVGIQTAFCDNSATWDDNLPDSTRIGR